MQWGTIGKLLGGLLVILGLFLLIPALHAYFSGDSILYLFLTVSGATIIGGASSWYRFREHSDELSLRTGFAIVTFSWLTACFVGAFPYFLSGTLLSFVDSLFESVSGFSGTGASVLTSIESCNRSVLLWRSMTQWIGGMGIIVFFIAILPILGVGGVQLFRAETPGPQKDKITPRVQDTAKMLWRLYVAFTLILAALLMIGGMSSFDALNHAMTTLSTGGFSTRDAGIASFNSAFVDYAIIAFMFIGSINFSIHYRLLVLQETDVFRDTELRSYGIIILLAALIFIGSNYGASYDSLELTVRKSLFTVLATASSTGFTNANYIDWSACTHFVLILLMVMGGMSGSTGGGMKCIRLVAAFRLLLKELKQVVHPSAILTVKMNNKSIRPNVASAIWGFMFIYLFIFTLVAGVLSINGLDLVSAGTATFSALSNIGPALGQLGPYDNYALLPLSSKAALAVGMIMGRLEFFTVVVLFTPSYWKG